MPADQDDTIHSSHYYTYAHQLTLFGVDLLAARHTRHSVKCSVCALGPEMFDTRTLSIILLSCSRYTIRMSAQLDQTLREQACQ
jgi:hypothetical protein